MGKKIYLVNGKYFIIDDETRSIKRVVIQDETNIQKEDLEELVKILADALAKEEKD